MINRKTRALFMALSFLLVSVFPIKPVRAFAPVMLVGAFLTTSTGANVTIGGTMAAVGLAGLYLTIQDAEQNAVRVPLGEAPANQPPAPQVAATAPASGGGAQQTTCGYYGGITYDSPAACEAAALAQCQVNCQVYNNCSNCGMFEICASVACTINVPASCPGGYTLSGSTCVLVNPRQAQNDKTCDMLISGGQFATADDMNCSPSSGGALSPMIRDGRMIAYGTNSSGQPLMFEVAKTPQTYTITQYTQTQADTQTQVQKQVITVDAATSQITSVQTSTSPGSISSPSASEVPTVTDPVTQPTTTTNTPTVQTTEAQPIVFPTDYARRGEAASASQPIKTALDTIHTDLTTVGALPPDPTAPDVSSFTDSFFKDTFANLLAWRLPAHSSVCPVITFDYMMFSSHQVHTMDAQCTIAEQIRPVMSVVMVVVWTIVALFVLLEA